MKILSSGVVTTVSSHSPGVPTFLYHQQLYCFSLFLLLVPNVKLTILIPQSKCLISAALGSKISKILLGNISYEYVLLFLTIIIIGCYGRNCGKDMAFGKFFVPSLIGFHSLTRPTFKLHVRNLFEEL